ncbi:12058_t:CDS:2, partial [Dentiscutata heterogama]
RESKHCDIIIQIYNIFILQVKLKKSSCDPCIKAYGDSFIFEVFFEVSRKRPDIEVANLGYNYNIAILA